MKNRFRIFFITIFSFLTLMHLSLADEFIFNSTEIEISEDEPIENKEFNEELIAKGKFGSNWAKELGIGLGFGLRVDIQSFVIRLDLASPLQVPYLPEGERIRTPFLDGGSDNLIFNFAIGYPF